MNIANMTKTRKKKTGFALPLEKIHRRLCKHKGEYANKVLPEAAVYLTAVLEYLVSETLELAGYEVKNVNHHRIEPRHILRVLQNDEELERVLGPTLLKLGYREHRELVHRVDKLSL